MTIRHCINAHELNAAFNDFERCAEEAPAGAYQQAKDIRAMIGEFADTLLARARALGMKADNCDGIREIEAVIYGYLRDSNPDATVFAVSEGFGEAMTGPARERVMRQCAESVAFFEARSNGIGSALTL